MDKKLIALSVIGLILILGLVIIINYVLIKEFLESDEENEGLITEFEYIIEQTKNETVWVPLNETIQNITINETFPILLTTYEIYPDIIVKNQSFYKGRIDDFKKSQEIIEINNNLYEINFPIYRYKNEGYTFLINNKSYDIPCHKTILIDNGIFFGVERFEYSAFPEFHFVYYYIGLNQDNFNPISDNPYICV